MNENDLRRAFRALSEGELPVDFVDDIVRRLPDRPRQRGHVATAVVLAVALAGLAVVTWTVSPRWLGSEPDAFSPSIPLGSGLPLPTQSTAEAAGGVILAIEITPGGTTVEGSRPNELVFRLDADGTARYHDYEFGESRSGARMAYLTPEQVRALIDFAIGLGGMAVASEHYERGSLGPSGHTIIRLDSPDLVKTVDYGLAPGNLVRDDDPTLGGLPDLVNRLSHFSDDVASGAASGGLLLTEVERAESIALADPRFSELLATATHTTDRVVPVPDRDGDVLVYVSIADGGEAWPSIDACEIGGADGPATGIVWQVDLAAGEIVAVSPRWGSVDCLGSHTAASPPSPTVSAPPFEEGEARCQNEVEGYSVSYPADWTVHPADPEQEIPACHYFGPGPFDVDPSDGAGISPSIDIGVFSGACLEFDAMSLSVELEEVVVAGYPAVRAEAAHGGYSYILNLRGDGGSSLVEPNDPTPPSSDECRGAHGLMIAGRDWGAIHGQPLRRVVDRMAATIEIVAE